MKETILPNIDLSSEVIVFDQQTRQGQLIITNKHPTLGTIFKIKATKLNIIDVKPAKGFIHPQGKIAINFKLTSNMTPQEMQTTENNDKFLIQFLNITNQQATREEVEAFWKAYKNNTVNLEHGYGCYRVFMNLSGKKKLSISNLKSETMSSQMFKSMGRTGMSNDDAAQSENKTEQLSKKYTELKQQEEQLKQKRQNIFKSQSTPQKPKSGKAKAFIVFILLFVLSFLAGNYVRSTMVKVKVQKLKQEKKSFFHIPFFD